MFKYLSHIIILISYAVLAAVTAGYNTFAAADMVTKVVGASTTTAASNDSDESAAHSMLIIAAAIEWAAAAGCVLEALALIMFAEELMESNIGPILLKLTNYGFFGILIAGSILSGIAASKISKGENFGSNQDEYNYAMHSTLIAAISSGLYIVIYTSMHVYASYKKGSLGSFAGVNLLSKSTEFDI